VHAGDTQISDAVQVLTDGSTYWRSAGARQLQEFDPASGRAGRLSVPASIDYLGKCEGDLDLAACSLLPIQPGLEDTPLGHADGLLGWTVRECGAQVRGWHGRRIDGVVFRGEMSPHGGAPLGLVDVPGAQDGPRPLCRIGNQLSLWSTHGRRELFRGVIGQPSDLAAGSPLVLPPPFWHCLRPRDPAGSRALRSVTDAVGHQLFDSAQSELKNGQRQLPATHSLIERLIPQLTHPRLRTGIAGICRVAAQLAQRHADLVAALSSTGHAR